MGKMDFVEHKSGLLVPSLSYKPFRYPWAYDFWQKQQQVHWMPEEVPLGEDCKDWATNITESERNLLTQIFRFFTQSDVEVGGNYMENYMPLFKPVEVRMMLASFSNMLAFEMGPVEGMTSEDIKRYIRYIADWRMGQLGLKPIYGIDEHPLPWLTEITNGVEHANFFEARATEYSKGATQGDWHGDDGVWSKFAEAETRKAQLAD